MSQADTYRNALLAGADQLAVQLDDHQTDQLLAYHAGLVKWNQAYNLTAVRDPLEMISRHLLDSLAIVPFLPAGSLLDVGTGAGLPGVVVAMVRPDIEVTCLDSNGKKIRFIRQMIMELGLKQVATTQARVESFSAEPFNAITSRAFASLADMVQWSRHLLASDGQFLAMKGQYPEAELAALPAAVDVLAVQRLHVPGLPGERHLVRLGWSQ
ncbi:16S rRNA (guanine(527)-N(7))-methyltransferase RsmG [Natronospirillum operosum]|uniref:Ribosomal RNA small subunit methyltransferase G n=1 Tax=Natronospirillum operosum TaxID=2759953 RepID=A0A4Z0WCN6_9GAMM|nr:16S rRNA (guanine(527)-N(7))-methyltransferase RsmG [Natronospirillum operosum]TGG91475.1 16S rRNA (guanine(527)-N(7))-methyltransferase RsmG [Natronospirillum operosum]